MTTKKRILRLHLHRFRIAVQGLISCALHRLELERVHVQGYRRSIPLRAAKQLHGWLDDTSVDQAASDSKQVVVDG